MDKFNEQKIKESIATFNQNSIFSRLSKRFSSKKSIKKINESTTSSDYRPHIQSVQSHNSLGLSDNEQIRSDADPIMTSARNNDQPLLEEIAEEDNSR